MKWVVDSNVAIVANGKANHASKQCELRCVEFLEAAVSDKLKYIVCLDLHGKIVDEYRSYLSYSGQPGTGDIFFKFLHDNMYGDKRVKLVSITPIDDETRGFDELPVNTLDPSDRKFLAVARVAKAKIVNATDSDWHEQHALTKSLHVAVEQLCPEHATDCSL